MLRDPDRNTFELDMQREVSDLLRTDTVELVPRSLVPSNFKVLPAIWSFRRKGPPAGPLSNIKRESALMAALKLRENISGKCMLP
jgi:hypothetical protein